MGDFNDGFIQLEAFMVWFTYHEGVRPLGAPSSVAGSTVRMSYNQAMIAEGRGWGKMDLGNRPHHQRPHLLAGAVPDSEIHPDDGLSGPERALARVRERAGIEDKVKKRTE